MKNYPVFAVIILLYGSRGLRILDCYNNTMVIFQDSPSTTFHCTDLVQEGKAGWGLGNGSHFVVLGNCYKIGHCNVYGTTIPLKFNISSDLTGIHMTIWGDHWNLRNTYLVCMTASCNFIIKSHPVLEGCTTTTSDGNVTSTCGITKAYSSDDTYMCIWKRNDSQQKVSEPEIIQLQSDNGREYLANWTCSFTQPLPHEEGVYIYTISTDPPPVQEYSHTILKGLKILDCNNNKIVMFEESTSTYTCTDIPPEADILWGLGGASDVWIGTCYKNGSCKVQHSNQFYNLSRSADSTESHVTIWGNHRDFNTRSLICETVPRQPQHHAQCYFIIKNHPLLEGCSVVSNDSTVTGTCRVTKTFSSDNIYRCIWKLNYIQQKVSEPEIIQLQNDSGREYLANWTCSFTQPLPHEEGVYIYTISTDPPPVQEYSRTIIVESPGNLYPTCPNLTEERENLRCQCVTNRTGAPPGIVLWDGHENNILEIENVTLENNNQNFTCLLMWRNSTIGSILYTLTVRRKS